jgi:hypothetical protein
MLITLASSRVGHWLGVGKSAEAAALTPIAKCIVNAKNNDVRIGGSNPPAGCTNVLLSPSSTNPAAFGEISIGNGGTLNVVGQATEWADSSLPLRWLHRAMRAMDWPAVASAETPTTLPPLEDICIENGGALQIGSATMPITSAASVTLSFIGDRKTKSRNPFCLDFGKGIDVTDGASLLMYGQKGVPQTDGTGVSWTTLAAPSGPTISGATVPSIGEQTLQLTTDVTQGAAAWQPGDWIVVGTTSFNPFETEFVQIATPPVSNGNGTSKVTLSQRLVYYHFGSLGPSTGPCVDRLGKTEPASFCDDASHNYGVDERAEVGLISRDITLTSVVPPDDRHWGGELMFHPGFKQVAMQGVRLNQFGKDQLGSYPIHFHHNGNLNNGPLINANSIDHSYNKCITIHSTSNLTIQNNICARIVGHIFYEELDAGSNTGDDSGLTFTNNLGLGAMSNSFDINPVTVNGTVISRASLIEKYWWAGDHLVGGYDGFNIPDTDNQTSGTRGSCQELLTNGGFGAQTDPPCEAPKIYIEPASGFWIQNPGTALTGNAIGGCQGVGRAYWWVPPGPPIKIDGKDEFLAYVPQGTFENNRGHSCYAGFYGESEYSVVSQVMTPHVGGQPAGASIVATFDGMTATRNRFRGVWLRPAWVALTNGRFATNREDVSLVTSGGIDGNAPGVWDLLTDSTVVGMSQNNVDRFGPCPTENQLGPFTGAIFGCIDQTPTPAGEKPHSADQVGQGYAPPSWNFFGYMLYDGPVRVFHDRFVNFNYDNSATGTGEEFSSQLDTSDATFLANYSKTSSTPTGKTPFEYEGDAVFGWFQSNQSSYPTGTVSRQLMFDNTNLRHQIYTELVSLNLNFNDGDKNTSVIDEDGTLSGLSVQVGKPTLQTKPVFPISLNNLPFNGTSNSVDECDSRGAQNQVVEGRDTSLMSPGSMGTLEFSTLYPYGLNVDFKTFPGFATSHWQMMTFTRDDSVNNGAGGLLQPAMTLNSRAGRGLWEPKVTSGFGYTVAVTPIPKSNLYPESSGKAGIAKWIDIGIADVVDPNISTSNPFSIRLGICYSSQNGSHPQNPDDFVVKRGFKSFTGGAVEPSNQQLLNYWTPLKCNNIDVNKLSNTPFLGNEPECPSGLGESAPQTLTRMDDISALTNNGMPNGTPNLGVFVYDPETGMLYLNVAQDQPNPVGPSPTGSCNANGTGDPSCPNLGHKETYYACPKEGCPVYTITLRDPDYTPGASTCAPYPKYAQTAPTPQNQLVLTGTDTMIMQNTQVDLQGTPYNTALNGPSCPATTPQ